MSYIIYRCGTQSWYWAYWWFCWCGSVG